MFNIFELSLNVYNTPPKSGDIFEFPAVEMEDRESLIH